MSDSILVSEGSLDEDPIYCTVRTVKIGDTDASGLIHFPNVSHWVAETFDDWFSSMGFGVLKQFAVDHCVTVVNSDITIRRSLGTDDRLEIEMWVSSAGTHSFKSTTRMTNASTRELAVIAELTHVWV
ncbi:MAG: acyl-CoA thioesterase, partial [Actinomycetota bacterium]|nr:acyl-CoA thioesterase [Actinomycetota bacterium]